MILAKMMEEVEDEESRTLQEFLSRLANKENAFINYSLNYFCDLNLNYL